MKIDRVYPRVCGEAFERRGLRPDEEGLSPRVRGSRYAITYRAVLNGSIPACAGKPGCSATTADLAGVYPRVCGEARFWSSSNRWETGLSPRVRGSPGHRQGQSRPFGSIPACAGKPSRLLIWGLLRRVYPRVCGEADNILAGTSGVAGLSPRVRGSRCFRASRSAAPGSIPACAGKPSR